MKKNLIREEYKKKINLIQKYNKHYYDKDNPIVSDQIYDLLKSEIIDFENKYEYLKSKKSPSELSLIHI